MDERGRKGNPGLGCSGFKLDTHALFFEGKHRRVLLSGVSHLDLPSGNGSARWSGGVGDDEQIGFGLDMGCGQWGRGCAYDGPIVSLIDPDPDRGKQ